MTDAFLYDGLRSPFGRHAGALAPLRTDDLLAQVVAALVARSPFAPESIEDMVMGCTNQAGEDSRNVGRNAALRAGLPIEVAGLTVNRLCGSGLAALLDTARAVRCGEGDVFLAGGVEGMSRAPFVMAKATAAFSRSSEIYDTTMGARFPNPAVTALYGADSMPETADNIASDLGITRDEADAFALGSQQKFAAAQARGFFKDEIQPIEVPVGRKKPPVVVSEDEHPRPQTDAASLAKLRPLFEGGVVTAGNASGINDGAAALIVTSGEAGKAVGATPRARIVTGAVAGVPPRVMGLGPVPAIQKALARAGLTLDQMDVIEINEAFASQVLGCCKQLGLDAADSRLNPNGGAIAVGHPLGASGGRIALSALRQLEATGGRYAVVSMCIGIGQGIAVIIERV
jgi:acetyl-CoA C-acetyltransferase